MPEAGNFPDGQGGDGQVRNEKRPVSRIVVEFAGPGMADVAHADFQNISVGQMLVFARWADWQANRAVYKLDMQRRMERERKGQIGKIIVPRGVIQ